MSIKELVSYQKIDFEVYKLERDVYQSKELERVYQLQNVFKDRRDQLPKMEKELEDLFVQLDAAKAKIAVLEARKADFKADFDTFDTIEKFDEFEKSMTQYDAEVSEVYKDTMRIVKRIAEIGSDSKRVSEQMVAITKENNVLRAKIEAKMGEVAKNTQKQRQELSKLASTIDKPLFDAYKALRKAKKMPAIVPHNKEANACYVCAHEVNMGDNPYVICGNCGRIVYNQELLGGKQ